MAKDYKQYWYPDVPYAGESIAIAGCGPTSVSDLIEVPPQETAAWMESNGLAVPYQGTIYEGISACLTAYGADGVMIARDQDYQEWNGAMEQWCQIIQSGFMGILLMHACKTTYWTTGGHYIAIVQHDPEKGFLVYDPASDARTGWHGWGDFAGDISALYTSNKRWKPEENDKYMFEFNLIKKGDSGSDVKTMQAMLRGRGYLDDKGSRIKVDGSWGARTQQAFVRFQNTVGLVVKECCDEERWKKLLWR